MSISASIVIAAATAFIPAIKSVDMVAPASGYTCAHISTGELKCWGANGSGQLGRGDNVARGTSVDDMGDALVPVNLGTGRSVKSFASFWHTCAVLDNDALKCWGKNVVGELGLGDKDNRGDVPSEMGDALPAIDLGTGRVARSVSVGIYHTCALLDNGALKCWGQNFYGTLGLGDKRNRGSLPGEMGDALPAVDLGQGRVVSQVSAGFENNCVVFVDGDIKCWGDNDHGKLGLGQFFGRGDQRGDMGDALPVVDLGAGRKAKAVSVGPRHTCALLRDGAVKCWGCNEEGELGLGDTRSRGEQPGDMGDALPTVDLGSGRTALAVSAGEHSTCAYLDDHSVKCWGFNGNGELGIGDTVSRGAAPGQMGDALPAIDFGGVGVRSVAMGYMDACALLANGGLKCWGSNTYGQLGYGDANNRGGQPGDIASAPFAKLWD